MKKNKILKIFVAIIILISINSTAIATTGIVNSDTVRVREKPSTAKDSEIIGLVSVGRKVTIIGEEDNWYKVKATDDHGNNIEGYIRKDLLNVEGNLVIEEPRENNGNSVQEPNQIEQPSQGEEPNEEEKTNNDNSAVIEKNDKSISKIKSTEGVSVGKKLEITGEIKIKILPSANSNNIAKIEANTEVQVLEIINKWCRIETAEGVCGWVRIDQ